VAGGIRPGIVAAGGFTGVAHSFRHPPIHAIENNKKAAGRDIANSFLKV
jgi:hypothetical protein